jgi:hypothetical protein
MILQLPLEAIWGSAAGFIAMMVLAIAGIGIMSKSLSIPAMGAYLTFAYYASETGIAVLEPTFYVTLTLIALGVAFKLWRLEGVGEI